MAMEYIYVCDYTKVPVALRNFKGLYYEYTYESHPYLYITDEKGESVASFAVEDRTCYLLQRRNQSALQLHKVTPPHYCVDVDFWLFGLGRKVHCESEDAFRAKCEEYRKENPNIQISFREFEYLGFYLRYAFVETKFRRQAIAYWYSMPGETSWAWHGKEIHYQLIKKLHGVFEFQYPLQYTIHIFKGNTLSYPVETRDFFRKHLGYFHRNDVYYADLPGDF